MVGQEFVRENWGLNQLRGNLLGSKQISDMTSDIIPSKDSQFDWNSLQSSLYSRALLKSTEQQAATASASHVGVVRKGEEENATKTTAIRV